MKDMCVALGGFLVVLGVAILVAMTGAGGQRVASNSGPFVQPTIPFAPPSVVTRMDYARIVFQTEALPPGRPA